MIHGSAVFNRASGLAEIVIPPRSRLMGETVFAGMTACDGELLLLAVQRGGEDIGADRADTSFLAKIRDSSHHPVVDRGIVRSALSALPVWRCRSSGSLLPCAGAATDNL
jgi:hypothetical protein